MKCHIVSCVTRYLQSVSLIASLLLVSASTAWAKASSAENQPPIIDMHIHAFGKGFPYGTKDHLGNLAPESPDALFEGVYGRFREYNIVKAMVSGTPALVENWKSKDEENRIVRGITMFKASDHGMNADLLERMIKEGKIQVFGELSPFYTKDSTTALNWNILTLTSLQPGNPA